MENLRIGFIGLGNVGGKLAGNLLNKLLVGCAGSV